MLRLLLARAFTDFVRAQNHCAAHIGNAGRIPRNKLAVFHCDAECLASDEGVLIGGEVDELPVVLGLLVLDALPYVFRREPLARILHAVGDDDAHDVCGTFLLGHVREVLPHGIHRDADGVVHRRASGAIVPRHEVVVKLREVGGLNEADNLIVELKEVEHRFAGFLALFVQECVEGAFDVALDRAHGSGRIEDDDDVCVVLLHGHFLLVLRLCVVSDRKHRESVKSELINLNII